MKDLDIQNLLRRAEELKALFVLGQRVIPFLEDLFTFVGEIQPLLEEINNSIKENLSKMPSLSKQLSKVTEATELATNEILDIIDGIFYKLDLLVSSLNEAEKSNNFVQNFINDFEAIIKQREQEIWSNEDFEAKVVAIFDAFKENYSPRVAFDTVREIIENIRTDSTSIMLALQVQDITSQQIAAVNHLLTTVQSRLNSLISKFNSKEVETVVTQAQENINVTKLHREVAFDPDAVETLVGNSTKQDEIDKIFEEGVSVSQVNEDISITESTEQANEIVGTEEEEESTEGPISQSDIDALFSRNKPEN
jgi:chemotaxis regulatin CheY-phosphate phosphatase CheZ